MNKTETLAAIDARIVGVLAHLENRHAAGDIDDRRARPNVTEAQVKAEVKRLKAARKDVMSWPADGSEITE